MHGKEFQTEGNEYWKKKYLLKGKLFHTNVPEIWIIKCHLSESNIPTPC